MCIGIMTLKIALAIAILSPFILLVAAFLRIHFGAKSANSETFEQWYISQFLYAVQKAEARNMLRELRNKGGGYDDPHIEGCWYTYKQFGETKCLQKKETHETKT